MIIWQLIYWFLGKCVCKHILCMYACMYVLYIYIYIYIYIYMYIYIYNPQSILYAYDEDGEGLSSE